MRGIDYSKWDRLVDSDDDGAGRSDDESSDDERPLDAPARAVPMSTGPGVSVQRLDAPSRVTFGGPGPSPDAAIPTAGHTHTSTVGITPQKETRNGRWLAAHPDVGFGLGLLWSQSQEGVTLGVVLETLAAADVDADDINAAVAAWGNDKRRRKVRAVSVRRTPSGSDDHHTATVSVSLSDGGSCSLALAFDAVPMDEDAYWSVSQARPPLAGAEMISARVLFVELRKPTTTGGLRHWWDRLLRADMTPTGADLGAIDTQADVVDRKDPLAQREAMRAAWDEAHRLFREKRAQAAAARNDE